MGNGTSAPAGPAPGPSAVFVSPRLTQHGTQLIVHPASNALLGSGQLNQWAQQASPQQAQRGPMSAAPPAPAPARAPAAQTQQPQQSADAPTSSLVHRFRLADLKQATDCFSAASVCGEGGFGKVHRGILQDGSEVAVKALDPHSLQGDREFYGEANMLLRCRHPNLVSLMGICDEGGARLGVFEYCSRGSLRNLLDAPALSSSTSSNGGTHAAQRYNSHSGTAPGTATGPGLTWKERLRIALGAARGLAYLHDISRPPVIHQDFKSANILITEHGEPKVADFGTSRFVGAHRPRAGAQQQTPAGGQQQQGQGQPGPGQQPLLGPASYDAHVTTVTSCRGTWGYLAPEYAAQGHASVRSDVWAYGVVLLELLTGRHAMEPGPRGTPEPLTEWLAPVFAQSGAQGEGVLHALLDPHMPDREGVPFVQLAGVVEVAVACLQREPRKRPSMVSVAQHLMAILSHKSDYPVSHPQLQQVPSPSAAAATAPSASPASTINGTAAAAVSGTAPSSSSTSNTKAAPTGVAASTVTAAVTGGPDAPAWQHNQTPAGVALEEPSLPPPLLPNATTWHSSLEQVYAAHAPAVTSVASTPTAITASSVQTNPTNPAPPQQQTHTPSRQSFPAAAPSTPSAPPLQPGPPPVAVPAFDNAVSPEPSPTLPSGALTVRAATPLQSSRANISLLGAGGSSMGSAVQPTTGAAQPPTVLGYTQVLATATASATAGLAPPPQSTSMVQPAAEAGAQLSARQHGRASASGTASSAVGLPISSALPVATTAAVGVAPTGPAGTRLGRYSALQESISISSTTPPLQQYNTPSEDPAPSPSPPFLEASESPVGGGGPTRPCSALLARPYSSTSHWGMWTGDDVADRRSEISGISQRSEWAPLQSEPGSHRMSVDGERQSVNAAGGMYLPNTTNPQPGRAGRRRDSLPGGEEPPPNNALELADSAGNRNLWGADRPSGTRVPSAGRRSVPSTSGLYAVHPPASAIQGTTSAQSEVHGRLGRPPSAAAAQTFPGAQGSGGGSWPIIATATAENPQEGPAKQGTSISYTGSTTGGGSGGTATTPTPSALRKSSQFPPLPLPRHLPPLPGIQPLQSPQTVSTSPTPAPFPVPAPSTSVLLDSFPSSPQASTLSDQEQVTARGGRRKSNNSTSAAAADRSANRGGADQTSMVPKDGHADRHSNMGSSVPWTGGAEVPSNTTSFSAGASSLPATTHQSQLSSNSRTPLESYPAVPFFDTPLSPPLLGTVSVEKAGTQSGSNTGAGGPNRDQVSATAAPAAAAPPTASAPLVPPGGPSLLFAGLMQA